MSGRSMKDQWSAALQTSLEYFERSTACLQAEDANFKPTDGALTVAQQIAHVGQSTAWLVDGAFSPDGFDLSFANNLSLLEGIDTLDEARSIVRDGYRNALERVQSASEAEWSALLPEGPVMPGAPRHAVIAAIVDHTAHHRGALTVYSRLCGHTPAMPYM